jgi:hypothetical protein
MCALFPTAAVTTPSVVGILPRSRRYLWERHATLIRLLHNDTGDLSSAIDKSTFKESVKYVREKVNEVERVHQHS